MAYRDNVAKEILQTEQDYVNNLQTCINVFLNPLREAVGTKKEIVPQSVVKSIFSDFEIIHHLNAQLLEGLEPKVKNWHPTQTLGDIFIKIVRTYTLSSNCKMDFLKLYSNYIQNFNTSAEVISKWRKKSSFEKYLHESKRNPATRGLDLPDYLIMPIQRY